MKFILHTLQEFLKDKHYRSLLMASLFVLFGGALAYHYLEGWSYIDSLYFAAITLSTVGYGDFSPQTDLGKLFTIVYIGIGVGLILAFINTVYQHFRETRQQFSENKKGTVKK